MARKSIYLSIILLSAACSIVARPSFANDLLPVEDFAKLPRIGGPSNSTSVALAPDGAHYAAIIVANGKPALASIPTDGSKDIKLTSFDDYQPRWFRWATNRHLIVSFAFASRRGIAGTLETRLAVFDIDSGKLNILVGYHADNVRDEGLGATYFSQIQDDLVSRLPTAGDSVMVALDRDEPGLPSVYSFLLKGGSSGVRVLRHQAGIFDWRMDASGAIRLGYGLYRSGSGYLRQQARIVFRPSSADDFVTLATFDPRDMEGAAFSVLGFTEDPHVILIQDLNEQGRLSVYKLDTSTSKIVDTVFSNNKYDVESVTFVPGTDRLASINYMADEPKSQFFDDKEREDHEALGHIYPGLQSGVVSRDLARNQEIVRTESASSPPAYYYFDIPRKIYLELGSAYPDLAGRTLSETKPISYKARDGLQIDGYLTIPKGADPKNLPLIVNPHGGPESRDELGYDYWVQYFASRGWAVLQMNFRGSSGYGDDFRKAGEHQWGKAMQDDITDGVHWAIEQGIADPARICIVGASYGGYAALQGVATTPELYKCAVSLNGVSDIQKMITDYRFYAEFALMRDYLSEDDPTQVSPVYHADQIKAPVFIAYSTNDRNVNNVQSSEMISALRDAGKQVVELKLQDEDHYLTHESTRITFFQAMDKFLQENLGLGPVPSSEIAKAAGK